MKDVIDFYKDIPFNFTEDIDFYVQNIKRSNQILEYKDLHQLLIRNKSLLGEKLIKNVIEFGCGTGWLTNSLAYYYKKKVTSIDFTQKALEIARAVSSKLETSSSFYKSDIFEYKTKKTFDLVISLGVLHHTYDCRKAFVEISKFVKPRGFLYIGLYHLYGRRPMLKFLKSHCKWHGEESAYRLFKKMNKSMYEDSHSYSFFRDQVLHPHETQHTYEELLSWISKLNFKIVSTSINNYQNLSKFKNEDLLKMEKSLEDLSYERNVNQLEFMPGYFTLCAQKI
tara:strand:- start:5025 stop:5870 length:846 start_codon:yes stop_codon:yes gene_type:complete